MKTCKPNQQESHARGKFCFAPRVGQCSATKGGLAVGRGSGRSLRRSIGASVPLLLVFSCLAASAPAQAGRCYVDGTATGAADGMSWGDAYIDLQSALLNTECSEVWVAEGTYKPGTLRSDSFVVRPGTVVYGGFGGTETEIQQRNWVTHVTRLSGDIGTVGDNSDNSYHVVLMDGTVGTQIITFGTVLDGFVITAGNANNGATQNDRGGGMLCKGAGIDNYCSPELNRITFSDNFAVYGGAMYNQGDNGGNSSPILTGVAFSDNSASESGGAVFNDGSNGGASTPLIERVTFNGNTATLSGGAVYNDGTDGYSTPYVINSTFYNNSAELGGAMFNLGSSNGSSSPTFANVTFSENSANIGGALYSSGFNGSSTPSLINVILWANTATIGANSYNFQASPTIEYSIVQAGCPGGANCLSLVAGDPKLGPLQNNGGFTQTMLPGPGSAAIDTGDADRCRYEDQRIVLRPQGLGCDIGSVEVAEADDVIFANGFELPL